MPKMQHVDSSSIESIGYDSDNQKLYVKFLSSGKTYVYIDVNKSVYQEFLQADSKGGYLNLNIRNDYQYYNL